MPACAGTPSSTSALRAGACAPRRRTRPMPSTAGCPAPPPPPPPAPPPPPPPDYTISTETGQAIVPGVDDLGIHCDDCWRAVTFPFPVLIYGQTFTSANVNSNGVVNFTGENLWWDNGCL